MGRTGRPSTPLLSRDAILRTALAIVDEEGTDALSTTRIAARLGVRGPSLYKHVSGRDEIIDGMADLVIAEMGLDPDIRPWTVALETWARSYRAAFLAHPNVVPMLVARPVRSRAGLQGYSNTFAVLREAGWPEEQLLVVVQTIRHFIAGAILHHEQSRYATVPVEGVPSGLDPLFSAPPDSPEVIFETGLAILIRGFEEILDGLRAAQKSAARPLSAG